MTDNKDIKIAVKNISVFYSGKKALNKISMNIERNKITSLIGPSGCGKSTFLMCLNRMNDTIEGFKVMGAILIDGTNIYDSVCHEVANTSLKVINLLDIFDPRVHKYGLFEDHLCFQTLWVFLLLNANKSNFQIWLVQ